MLVLVARFARCAKRRAYTFQARMRSQGFRLLSPVRAPALR
jgi:hypothetical protein